MSEEFENIKGGNQNPLIEEGKASQWPKGQTTIYKTSLKKLKISNMNPTKKQFLLH
jgi:hypothetical protein